MRSVSLCCVVLEGRVPEGSGQQWRIGSISHGAAFGFGDESQEVVVARTEVASWGVTLGEVGDVWRSTDG